MHAFCNHRVDESDILLDNWCQMRFSDILLNVGKFLTANWLLVKTVVPVARFELCLANSILTVTDSTSRAIKNKWSHDQRT